MDPERDRDPPQPAQDDGRAPDPGLLASAEPDAEVVAAYAAWRLDQAEARP